MKKLLLAILAVALIASPAVASVQNVKISGDINSMFVVRDQFDLGTAVDAETFHQNVFFTAASLRVDADLTDNVGATIALINERTWGEPETVGNDGDMDILFAFVELREMLYSPLTVTIGRQEFDFGNAFVISSAAFGGATQAGSSVDDLGGSAAADAIRATLDYNPLTIDIIYAKNASATVSGLNPQEDDVDLIGANANYELGDDMDTVVEAYFWAKLDNSGKAALDSSKGESVYMPGIRVETNPLEGLNVSVEAAMQRGTMVIATGDHQNREAQAFQLIASYLLPFEQTSSWNPVVSTSYSYASGDSDPAQTALLGGTDDTYTAWDSMFEDFGGGTIHNTLFGFSNCHVATVAAQVNPMEDVTATLGWTGLWLDKPLGDTNDDGITELTVNQPDGSALTALVTDTDTKLGDELDLTVTYDYTEDVQFGASYGYFWPGTTFQDQNSQNASQVILNASVAF